MLEEGLEKPIEKELVKPKKPEAKPELLTIDKVFGEGASTVTYVGRNDSIIRTGLERVRSPLDKVLILACGPYELWTTAGQKALSDKKTEIVGVDRSEEITEINKKIQSEGSISIAEIASFVGSPIFGMDRHRDSNALLEEAQIEGFHLRADKIEVDKTNRGHVRVEKPTDVLEFVHTQKQGSYDFIFSGNLENNLLFQKGYTRKAALQFHQDIAIAL